MNPSSRLCLRAFALTLGTLSAACGPLVQVGGGGKPPSALFVLRAPPPPLLPRSNVAPVATVATVLVDAPTVVGTLQTLRVPVTESDTRITYLVAATWAEQPSRQFQRLLIDTLSTRSGIVALPSTQLDGHADRRLSGTLIEFGLDMRDPARPQVRLRFDAVLTGPARALVAARRFDAVAPVASADPATVAVAINGAANAMALDVAAWAGAV